MLLSSGENFFQVGSGLAPNNPSYVVRRADDELYDQLLAGNFCYVLNSRQMGKTSLRRRTSSRLRSRGVCCASVDLSGSGSCEKPDQWYAAFLNTLVRECGIEDSIDWRLWWRKYESLPPANRLFKFIEKLLITNPSKQLVIFVDEIDSVLNHEFSLDDFFVLIRSTYENRGENSPYCRLTFALLGVASPYDLIRDEATTPFNISEQGIDLYGFDIDEIHPLEAGLSPYVHDPSSIMQEIIHWTGGQPLLTQKLCQLVVRNVQSRNTNVNSIVHSSIISDWETHDTPEHLRTIRDRIVGKNQRYTGKILELYQHILEHGEILFDDSPEQRELRLSGLVVKEKDVLKVFNRIYQEVFSSAWVQRELDQLRPYRSNFQEWISSGKKRSVSLLKGTKLSEAQKWAEGKSLPVDDYHFLDKSRESQALRRIRQAATVSVAIFSGSAIAAMITTNQAVISSEKARAAEMRTEEAQQREKTALSNLSTTEKKLLETQDELKVIQTLLSATQSSLDETQQALGFSNLALTDSEEARRQAETGRTAAIEARDYAQGEAKLALISRDQAIDEANFAEHKQYLAQEGTRLERAGNDALQRFGINQISGLRAALKASIELYELATKENLSLSEYPAISPLFSLRKMLETSIRQITWRVDTVKVHQDIITDTRFSHDSNFIVTSSKDNTAITLNLSGKVITRFGGHSDTVNSVDIHPTQPLVLTASSDGTAKLWTLEGAEISSLEGHTDKVTKATFSPDGKYIATASIDKTVRIWTEPENPPIVLQHIDPVHNVTFSPDGQYILTKTSDGILLIWNLSGQPLPLIGFSSFFPQYTSAFFSPNGELLIIQKDDGSIQIWKWKEMLQKIRDKRYRNIRVMLLPENSNSSDILRESILADTASSTTDITTEILRTGIGKEIISGSCQSPCLPLIDISPYEQKILFSMGGSSPLKIIDYLGNELAQLRGHELDVMDAQFSADGQQVVTASLDGTAKIWDVSGNLLASLVGHEDSVFSADFSPDGKTVITTAADNSARIWHLGFSQSRTIRSDVCDTQFYPLGCFRDAVFSPDGISALVISSVRPIAEIWDLSGNKKTILNGHTDDIFVANFSEDGGKIITASADKTARLWNLSGNQLAIFQGHQAYVRSAEISPNSKHVITASRDRTVRLWDISGNPIKVFSAANEVSSTTNQNCPYQENRLDLSVFAHFSADGKFAAMGLQTDHVKIIDILGNELVSLRGHSGCIQQARFSPVGEYIVTASDDGTAMIWNFSGQKLVTLKGHRANVIDAKFSKDGKSIITISYDNTVRIWNIFGQELAALGGVENCEGSVLRRNCIEAAEFSPDSQMVLTRSADNIIRVWDLRGRLLGTLLGSTSEVGTAHFSPDSQSTLITLENEVQIWPIKKPEDLIREGCNWLKDSQNSSWQGIRIFLADVNSLYEEDDSEMCDSYQSSLGM